MNLRSGTRLGPYEITGALGAGGMGEVYKAKDTRLGRTVAIKILPAEFSSDAKLKIRFEREAKVISALNHPHICTLHDVGENYLVMEYCEGQTLAARLERGPISVDQVIEYGAQICEALEKAHRSGIIHRDLKPSNIMITKSGVKLVDFGLAREQSALADDHSGTSTVDRDTPSGGKLVGTIQYMAPETLSTGHADARSDLFSFGLVLYEMITGKRAFEAASKASLIAAILDHEPHRLLELRPDLDPQLDLIVSRSLQKDPEKRWQSAADVAVELRWLQTHAAAAALPKKKNIYGLQLAVALLLVFVSAAVTFLLTRRQMAAASVERRITSVFVKEDPITLVGGMRTFTVSSDGKLIAFAAGHEQRLYLRSLSDSESKPLAETEGAIAPFFSPNGKSLGFIADGKLKRMDLKSGVVEAIAEGPPGFTLMVPVWGDDDGIVFMRDGTTILRVPASGGTVTEILKAPAGMLLGSPSLLPGSKKLVFTIWKKSNRDVTKRDVAFLDRVTRRYRVLFEEGLQPRYSPSGHILFARMAPANERKATIFSVPFNPETGDISGAPTARVTDVAAFPFNGGVYWATDGQGNILYVPHPGPRERMLFWVDQGGRFSAANPRVAPFVSAALSPDGNRVAYTDSATVWVGDLVRNTWLKLTDATFTWAQSTVWSPDGRQIAFEGGRDGKRGIWVVAADGSADPRVLLDVQGAQPSSWSRDGSSIAFLNANTLTIATLDIASGRVTPVIDKQFSFAPVFSPDGKWIAFSSFLSLTDRQARVHVRRYPASGPLYSIFTAAPCVKVGSCGDTCPVWSEDGRQIVFWADQKVMAVDIDTNGGFRSSSPKVLFETDHDFGELASGPVSKRLLVVKSTRDRRWDHFNILSGWWAP